MRATVRQRIVRLIGVVAVALTLLVGGLVGLTPDGTAASPLGGGGGGAIGLEP